MTNEWDVVVVGGGTGGYVAAIRGAQLGLRVAVVESSDLGGTCLHRGCIPSKALLRTAEVFSTAQQAASYGVDVRDVKLDIKRAMERKASIVTTLHRGVTHLMKKHNIEVIRGFGRIMGPSIFSPSAGAVRVTLENGDEQTLTPRSTIIATGSSPRALPGLPFDGKKVLSSDDVLTMEDVPSSILIVGGGAIGVEWASMFQDFGTRVTVVEATPSLLIQEDEEIGREMTRLFKKRGITVLTNATLDVSSIAKLESGIEVDVVQGDRRERVSAEVMLVAIGRSPNVENIGLEATRVNVVRGAIEVDEHLRTAEPTIYAIGDVIGGLQLAHVASHEGIHAMETIAGIHSARINYDQVARCTYSRPEVASVGISEKEARARGHNVKAGKFSFKANGKALIFGESDGFVRILADVDTGDLLGVHMIGPHVTDLISEASLAMVLDAIPWEIGHTIHPHPTLSEVIGEAALGVTGEMIHG
ncbi:dihydrolipoyl dehydrogenase [Ferroacidibacillus organovorans]|uniref:Dihydrolipoyl dehydrogenase n=3 Tax=Ferroacidibacillus organovorans TaxID=1765683 RepID=A0A1V4ERG6_9BACL|nr:dihydrolipoyl dehydrogenase [Ferroacidibacillus organovorans]OPG15526.1 dihydrolipoyl dehydrogenase [Ferroacidibacillus organovorans]